MEISLHDYRAKSGEPAFDTDLGESTSVSLSRDRGQHILDIKTDLAYHLSIRMTKADVDELRKLIK